MIIWQRGYRVHGYWTQDDVRIGWIGLSPRFVKPVLYTAHVESQSEPLGTFRKLRQAKKAVELACYRQ